MKKLLTLLSVIALSASLSAMAGPVNCPSAFKDGQLIVDGKPFTLVEIAQADGINLDKPNRARKVGNEM